MLNTPEEVHSRDFMPLFARLLSDPILGENITQSLQLTEERWPGFFDIIIGVGKDALLQKPPNRDLINTDLIHALMHFIGLLSELEDLDPLDRDILCDIHNVLS